MSLWRMNLHVHYQVQKNMAGLNAMGFSQQIYYLKVVFPLMSLMVY